MCNNGTKARTNSEVRRAGAHVRQRGQQPFVRIQPRWSRDEFIGIRHLRLAALALALASSDSTHDANNGDAHLQLVPDNAQLIDGPSQELNSSKQDASSFASRFPWVPGPLEAHATHSGKIKEWRRRRVVESQPRFSFKQLHGASLAVWSLGLARMARPAPAVAILEPADGAVLLRECSGGEVSPHFQLTVRVDFNMGLLSAADLERAPAEGADYGVVINGQLVAQGVLFRKCPASDEALAGLGHRPDGRHLCDAAVNPQGTLSQHQIRYLITANVSFECPAEHEAVVNLLPRPPFPAEEVSALAHFSIAARRIWQPSPAAEFIAAPVPPAWFEGVVDADAQRKMSFETHTNVCGSDGALARGRRVVDTFAGFSYDYAVDQRLLQRLTPTCICVNEYTCICTHRHARTHTHTQTKTHTGTSLPAHATCAGIGCAARGGHQRRHWPAGSRDCAVDSSRPHRHGGNASRICERPARVPGLAAAEFGLTRVFGYA